MKRMQRILSALLVILLLPLTGMAETAEQGHGLRMDLSFQMNADAYPDDMQELMPGIADALNETRLHSDLTWRGDLFSQDTSFNAQNSLSMGEREDVLSFRLRGVPSHILVSSPLLGDQQVMLNMLGWLEFSIKANFQMGIPLYQIAPFISTYANTSAFEAFLPAWQETMCAEAGSRTISAEDAIALAESIAETAENDRSFSYWLQALLLDSGCDEMVMEYLSMLPDWVASFVDEEEGIQVTAADGEEIWTTGEETLFTRNGESWELTLPATEDGYTAALRWTTDEESRTLQLCFGQEDENDILDFTIALSGLPTEDADAGQAVLTIDRTGEMLGETHMRWQADWSREEAAEGTRWQVRAAEINTETNAEMLVISGTLTAYTPDTIPAWTAWDVIDQGVNIFSVYEDTLTEFVHNIAKPFVQQILPVLAELPYSTYQSLFALMEQFHVLDLLSMSL